MAFSPPVVGCLVKKGLQKGGSRAPQDPPLATPLVLGSTSTCLVSMMRLIAYSIAYAMGQSKREQSKGTMPALFKKANYTIDAVH